MADKPTPPTAAPARKYSFLLLVGLLVAMGLYLTSLHHYLLFHSLVEIFSIVIACGIFMVAWNSRFFSENHFLLFLGIAYLFVAGLDLLHTLSFKGMGVFPGYDANLPTQLWIVSRYVESLSLLIAPLFLGRRMRPAPVWGAYVAGVGLGLGLIFYWKTFPDCFIEGTGLTAFKKGSEYLICLILLAAGAALFQRRRTLHPRVWQQLVASIFVTIASELAFTLYLDVYGLFNLIGHFLKTLSFYLVYRAIIETGLRQPFQLLFRDLAEQQEALRKSEEHYRLLFHQSPLGVFHYDLQLHLTDCNQRLAEILQWPREDLPGFDLNLFQDPPLRQALQQAKEGQVGFCEGSWVTPEGKQLWLVLRTTPLLDQEGAIRGALGLVEDLTEQRQLTEQLLQAQKMESLGTLVTGIAHNFNNLLTGVLGRLELACWQAPKVPTHHLEMALQAGHRAADLVQQLLLFAREVYAEPQPLALEPLLQETAQLLQQTVDRRIEIRVQVAPDLPEILADPSQIHQVLMNLGLNARDAIMDCLEGRQEKPGWEMGQPFHLTFVAASVTVGEREAREREGARAGEFVRLSVTDDGAGMDEKTQKRIFEPFFTTKEVGQGTGMGLATVYGIVQEHGGWIQVRSAPGQGTTFQIFLPTTGEASAVPEEEPAKTDPDLPEGTETILLVDDEEPLLELGQAFLEDLGYTVLLARDGAEAVEKYSQEQERIDLVILDLTMPRLSGHEVLSRLRELDPSARVLISSGHDEVASAPPCLRLGAVGFLGKPFKLQELAEAIRQALDGRKE